MDARHDLLAELRGREPKTADTDSQCMMSGFPGAAAICHHDGHLQRMMEHKAEIAKWRADQARRRTEQRRPDLLAKAHLRPEDRRYIESLAERPEEDR